ncbi:MAG: hypothetical protein R3B99_06065 [Polyangiales bacterium]
MREAPEAVYTLYPSPYTAGMSSLGYQTLYRTVNETPGRAAHRAFRRTTWTPTAPRGSRC